MKGGAYASIYCRFNLGLNWEVPAVQPAVKRFLAEVACRFLNVSSNIGKGTTRWAHLSPDLFMQGGNFC